MRATPTRRSTRPWSAGVWPRFPAKKEPTQSRVPLRLFRYDARHDIVKCPRGKTLSPRRPAKGGRYYRSRTRDCAGCALRLDCLPKAWSSKVVLVPHEYPALLRARRRHARWGEEERRMYRRHMWRSEGYHGEAKTWHGLARAVRRGLENMKIQSYLTAAAINLKRLSAALAARLFALWRAWSARGRASVRPSLPRKPRRLRVCRRVTFHTAHSQNRVFQQPLLSRV